MNELKKYLWQKKMMEIKYILICILGFDRVKYLKQHNVFAELGDNVLYQPIKLPNEQSLLKYIIMKKLRQMLHFIRTM